MTPQKHFHTRSKLNITNTQISIPVSTLKKLLLCQVALFLICFFTFSKNSQLPSATFIASSGFALGEHFSFHMKIQLK